MGNVTLPFLTRADTDDNLFSNVKDNDQAIVDVVNGSIDATNLASNAVTTAKITDANVTDAKLASPNNSVYRSLLTSKGYLTADLAAATFMLGSYRYLSSEQTRMVVSGVQQDLVATTITHLPPDIIYFDDADYTVGSKTQKLRLRAQVAANATQPTITFTFGLYPITVAGGTDVLTYTLGTVVSSSTVAIASPAASTVTSGVNSDFAVPVDGAYALGVVTSGTLTNNSAVSCHAQLQTRNV